MSVVNVSFRIWIHKSVLFYSYSKVNRQLNLKDEMVSFRGGDKVFLRLTDVFLLWLNIRKQIIPFIEGVHEHELN